jgi:hypothetical protein
MTPANIEPSHKSKTENPQQLSAYEIYPQRDMPLLPAPILRPWMEKTQSRFAYRCLPLTLANQAGWIICNPASFCARWNGGPRREDTALVFDQVPPDKRISSLFGHGVITFNMPYLFRTPEGINLWVKGPTNWPKDGVQALEGLVETDWTAASFTMNWKLTRPGRMVRFERGEPICMIVPYPRGLLENCLPLRLPLAENPELKNAYERWSRDRDDFHRRVAEGDQETLHAGWQKDYFQGRDPGSDRFVGHQTKLGVKSFVSSSGGDDV